MQHKKYSIYNLDYAGDRGYFAITVTSGEISLVKSITSGDREKIFSDGPFVLTIQAIIQIIFSPISEI